MRICETLGEDMHRNSRDFGRGFARIHARLWERIHETLGEDS